MNENYNYYLNEKKEKTGEMRFLIILSSVFGLFILWFFFGFNTFANKSVNKDIRKQDSIKNIENATRR